MREYSCIWLRDYDLGYDHFFSIPLSLPFSYSYFNEWVGGGCCTILNVVLLSLGDLALSIQSDAHHFLHVVPLSWVSKYSSVKNWWRLKWRPRPMLRHGQGSNCPHMRHPFESPPIGLLLRGFLLAVDCAISWLTCRSLFSWRHIPFHLLSFVFSNPVAAPILVCHLVQALPPPGALPTFQRLI